jgi:DNA-binding Lrp family transcriptional regulator
LNENNQDVEILKILEENAKASPEDISAMLNLDTNYVRERIKELEKQRVIIAYKTLIDWEKIKVETVKAFIDVKVIPEHDYGFDTIARKIYNFPEVEAVYLMSGTYDLAVIVQGKSMKEVAYFVAEKLATLEHVQSTVTHFVLKKYKVDGKVLAPQEDKRLTFSP